MSVESTGGSESMGGIKGTQGIQAMRFWKMSGAGNDFIVVPGPVEDLRESADVFVKRVCHRRFGVGADGVLFVTPEPGVPRGVRLVHYNADGGRSEFCGNGSRCAARFAVLKAIASSPILLHTDCGALRASVDGDEVRIEVPVPSEAVRTTLGTQRGAYAGWRVTAGVPHFVLRVEDTDTFELERMGPILRRHPALGQEGANIDVVGPAHAGRYPIRTFERGVEGETLACGSGAIAAAAVLAREGVPFPIVFLPPSGIPLTADFQVADRSRVGGGPPGGQDTAYCGRLTLAGEARVVFEGWLPGSAGSEAVIGR